MTEPSTEAKLWVITQLAQFIHDHKADGTFRTLIYDYLNLTYQEAYLASGMTITNRLSKDSYEEYVECLSCEKEDSQ
jgi:hypothetical protein